MRSGPERSRHNLNKLSTLLDSQDLEEREAIALVQRFHRRSQYLVLAIGVGKKSSGEEPGRWIFVASKQLPSGRQTDAEWLMIQFGIDERSIRFQGCASRTELLRAFRSIVTPIQMSHRRRTQPRSAP